MNKMLDGLFYMTRRKKIRNNQEVGVREVLKKVFER
jgi:hypothetical protein